MSRVYDAALGGAGMTTTQFAVLRTLDGGGAMPLSRLADLLVMDRTSLYRTIAPLARQGWVRIEAAPRGRTRIATLTTDGAAAMTAAVPAWEGAQGRIVAAFGPANWAALAGSLREITGVAVREGAA